MAFANMQVNECGPWAFCFFINLLYLLLSVHILSFDASFWVLCLVPKDIHDVLSKCVSILCSLTNVMNYHHHVVILAQCQISFQQTDRHYNDLFEKRGRS